MRVLRSGALLLAILLLPGCVLSSLESVGEEPTLASSFVRPDDPQEEIGAREHPLVLAKYGGEYRNGETEAMLALIVGRLVAVSQDPERIYKVTILDTPKVNAFALPGGYLYVTRGLIALANDSSEIAAVIAHEMAHVTANHAILRQEKLSGAQVGEEVVNEVLGETLAARVALAANQLKLADFSRDQELQADAIGIRMIGQAGFDPYAASRFLNTMQAYQAMKSGESGLEDAAFLSSHPTTPKRVELAVRHARFFGAPGIGERGRERYLRGIDGMLFGDSAEEGFVRGRTFSHSTLGITFSVPPQARIDNQTKAVIVTGPDEAATRFDATSGGDWDSLGEYLASGWINGLKRESVREFKSAGNMSTAIADAEADGWRFRIKIFEVNSQIYRFITAVPAGSGDPVAISEEITQTFRNLTDAEMRELLPLRLRIVTVKPGDTLGSLAAQMKTGDNKLRLLRLINSLRPEDMPTPGSKIKIVTDRI